jgi:bifunctional non-homologous end joining protein LigD
VRLLSRNRTNFNNDYPQLIDALERLTAKNVIIDGEIAALDSEGKSSFQLLQSYRIGKQPPLVYYAFDLLFLEGTDLRSAPLIERRKLLKKAPDNIRFSEELRGEKEKPQSQTDPTARVCDRGYRPPEGSRKYFGALLVGYQSPTGLLFAGRAGAGFSEKVLADLYEGLQKIRRPTCPFVNLPEKRRGRWGQGITPAVMKRCHWVEPLLVAQVKFTKWTSDDQLRQPVFLGLRTDKEPKDVVRE